MVWSRLLATRPLVVFAAVAVLLLAGLGSVRRMPVDLLPGLNYPLINVVTQYPAGTARDMELLVTRPIEHALQGLQQVRRVRSVSTAGFSQVTVEFDWGVDVLAARQLVSSALAQVRSALPSGVQPQLENLGTSLAMISTYTVAGDASPVAMRNWVDAVLAPALTAQPGVARVQVMGGGVQALRVSLDPLALQAHGLSATAVVQAIRRANVLDTGGFVTRHGRDVLVTTRAQLRTVRALRAVLLKHTPDGEALRLGDVAHVYAAAVPERYAITSDRQPAVAFMVQKQPGASTLAVSHAVDAALAGMPVPLGMQVHKFYDQAGIIGQAYRNLRDDLLTGALLSVLALFFVLGRSRGTLVVAVTLPLTVLGTFVLMRWFGLGLNLMTLGALIVTIGMINDDAVLVLESIIRQRERGLAALEAVRSGVREILAPDVAGTLVVLAAFLPLVLLGGIAGHLYLPFGATFSAVIVISLLLSLTLIPWAEARWPKPVAVASHSGGDNSAPVSPESASPASVSPAQTTWGSRAIAAFVRGNRRVLDALLRHRRLTLVLSVLAMLASMSLLYFNPVRFLPLLDEHSLLVSYQLAPGTSFNESNRVGDALEARLLHDPAVTAVFRRTGSPGNSYFLEGPDAGELVVRLRSGYGIKAAAVRERLLKHLMQLPGVLIRIDEPTGEKIDEAMSGLPGVFGITLYGSNLATLHRAADRLQTLAGKVPGLGQVMDNAKVPVDTLNVRVDRDASAALGVDPAAIARALRLAVQGEDVAQSVVDAHVLHIYVRFAPAARRDTAALAAIPVPARDGRLVPLGRLVHFEPTTAWPSVEHRFGARALTLTADISGNPLQVLPRLREAIAGLHLPAGVRVAFTGEYHTLLQTGGQLLLILLASTVLVFMVMSVQLRNLIDPLVVLFKLPIDFMGAALALFLTHATVDLTVLIGFITLVGVGVNNAIVLLDYARRRRVAGQDAVSAIHEAVAVRARPLLLTHMTSLLALLPAALGLGAGPQLLQSLALMLFGGLTVGTLLTMNLIPVLYVATDRWRRVI